MICYWEINHVSQSCLCAVVYLIWPLLKVRVNACRLCRLQVNTGQNCVVLAMCDYYLMMLYVPDGVGYMKRVPIFRYTHKPMPICICIHLHYISSP